MKNIGLKRFLCAFLALVFMIGMIPAMTVPAFAGHRCPDCDEWIDGEDYCIICFKCESCSGTICPDCGVCENCIDSEDLPDLHHCPDCMACSTSEKLCYLCHRCETCGDWLCDNDDSCKLCHEENDGLCPECGENPNCSGSETCPDEGPHCYECYEENHCEYCDRCLLCEDLEICPHCGACEECWSDFHCPECGKCYEDVPQCEEGGEHCVDCCYENEWLCADCGRCTEGAGLELCDDCRFCEDCWYSNNMHCEECGNCYEAVDRCREDDNATHCVECCEICSGCDECVIGKLQDFCEECGFCEDCCTCGKLDYDIQISGSKVGQKCSVLGTIRDAADHQEITREAWYFKWLVRRQGETAFTVVSTNETYTPVDADIGAYFRVEITVDDYETTVVKTCSQRITKDLTYAGIDPDDYVEGLSTRSFPVRLAYYNENYYVAESRFEREQDPVRAGDTNVLHVTLMPKAFYTFAEGLTIECRNETHAARMKAERISSTEIEFTIPVTAISNTIEQVELSIKAPVELKQCGENIGHTDKIGVVRNSVEWFDETEGQVLPLGKKFQAGHAYSVKADLYAKAVKGFRFAVSANGETAVSATVNGYQAQVSNAEGQEPEKVVTVRYRFGTVNDSVIDEINVNDLRYPYAGSSPDYEISLGGTGYSQLFGQGGYDVWGYNANGEIRKYYTINGITWYDITESDGKVVYETDSFKAGRRYRVVINLKADPDYEFNSNTDHEILVNGYLNGSLATMDYYRFDNPKDSLSMEAEFLCVPCEHSYVYNYAEYGDGNAAVHTHLEDTFVCSLCGAVKKLSNPDPNPFVDVPDSAWYAEAVLWAVANGVTSGTDATHFSPSDKCTRAQVVQFLYAQAGEPEPKKTENPFVDVKETNWYYKAVMWAVQNGITSGTDATHFSPSATCTRAQVVQFLYAGAGEPEPKKTENPFTDVKSTNWFYKAVMWAVENNITSGTTPTTFEPNATCTRAQIVQFLYQDAIRRGEV